MPTAVRIFIKVAAVVSCPLPDHGGDFLACRRLMGLNARAALTTAPGDRSLQRMLLLRREVASARYPLRGLDPAATYELQSLNPAITTRATGHELMTSRLDTNLPAPASAVTFAYKVLR